MFANGHLVLSNEAHFFINGLIPGKYPDVEGSIYFKME